MARTIEYTETDNFVPMLNGRFSLASLGITIHITTGLGSLGYKGTLTLGISCVRPTKVYAGMEICQIYYSEVISDSNIRYSGRYMNDGKINASKSYLDYEK